LRKEETKLCESIKEHWAQRNNQQRRIELEKKAEIGQVVSIPQDQQTEEEMKFYETTMTAERQERRDDTCIRKEGQN
jgi:hypothetical protein